MADATPSLKASAQEILNRKIILLDGGLGTTLEDEHNVKFSSEETPLWSSHLLISAPEILLKVQTDFANAGADVILTATYQASYDGMAKTPAISHWEHNTKEPPAQTNALFTSAVGISRSAIGQSGRSGLVALSLGAYGATLIPSQEYTGKYGEFDCDALRSFHSLRFDVFIDDDAALKNVDIIAFETLPSLEEIHAVRKVMDYVEVLAQGEMNNYGKAAEYKPYWISCVFPNDDDKLPDGSSIEEVVNMMLEKESGSSKGLPVPHAIGINCTKVHKLARLVKKFEEAAEKTGLTLPRLVIYPDGAGGLVYDTAAQKWAGDGSEEVPWDEQVFKIVKEVHERGKWKGILVGGCCKTTPRHIAKLRKRIDEWGVT